MHWILAEIAIAACDLAEVIGSAIALQLLFHIPLPLGVALTAFDVLVLLFLQRFRTRIEALVVLLVTIGICFGFEISCCREPDLAAVMAGFVPQREIVVNPAMLYIAIGILGATVMPHNLYLHSSIVQSRKFQKDEKSIRNAIRFNTIDATVNLAVAFLINAAILVLADHLLRRRTSRASGGRPLRVHRFDGIGR